MQRPAWLAPNFTEPRVLSVVRNLCSAGDDVLDVGANFGGITIAMSRAVGPRGSVFAFEANPGIAKRCQDAVVEAGCGNVQIVHGAIFSQSGQSIDLFLSDNQVADSIHYRVSENSIKVPTLALDDYVARMKISPSFVKMDIEGAEYEALLGFEKTIDFMRPIIILEQAPQEHRCIDFLVSKGYKAIDLSTYQMVQSNSDIVAGTVVTDILFGYGDSLERLGYGPGTSLVANLSDSDFATEHLMIRSNPVNLKSGRYVVQADFSSSDTEMEEIFCGILCHGSDEPVMQHHGHSHSLAKLAHRWVFDLPQDDNVSVFFRFARQKPASFRVRDVSVSKVTCSGAVASFTP